MRGLRRSRRRMGTSVQMRPIALGRANTCEGHLGSDFAQGFYSILLKPFHAEF